MSRKTPLICEMRSRRQTLGWSLKDLADHCGIDEKFLADWEHGVGSPRLDAAESWACALGLRLTLATGECDRRQGLAIDWQQHRLTIDGTPVRLTPMEWKALDRLAWSPGELVTHHDLFKHLYGEERSYRAQSTAVRVLITKLRRLLPVRIEAQWGRGYVIGGVESSRPPLPEPEIATTAREPEKPAAIEQRPWDRIAALPKAAPRYAPPLRRPVVDLGAAGAPRIVGGSGRPATCRAEELGVIERFLAERGATRCPDVATIEHSPLPTLVWDKIKRKWVRPSTADREAS